MLIQIELLLRLVIAHVLSDFLLQTEKSINDRKENKWKSKWLYIHATVYSLMLYIFSSTWGNAYYLIPVFFISHALIDGLKSCREDKFRYFLLDQFGHLIIICFAWLIMVPENMDIFFSLFKGYWTSKKVLLIILGYLLILWPSGHLIGYFLRPFREGLKNHQKLGLANAGLWIGYLERFLVFSFVIVGYVTAVGFLITAKSIFRFGEIKDTENREVAEYIIIGSFFSFVIALTLGYFIHSLSK